MTGLNQEYIEGCEYLFRSFVMSDHSHKIPDKKRIEWNAKIVEILKTVPYEKGFHFYIVQGNFSGITATSMDDFEKKLQIVPAESVNFHLQREDFQKWIAETLGDRELAKRVSSVKLNLPVEDLRKELLEIVQTRITEIRQELPHELSHNHS